MLNGESTEHDRSPSASPFSTRLVTESSHETASLRLQFSLIALSRKDSDRPPSIHGLLSLRGIFVREGKDTKGGGEANCKNHSVPSPPRTLIYREWEGRSLVRTIREIRSNILISHCVFILPLLCEGMGRGLDPSPSHSVLFNRLLV